MKQKVLNYLDISCYAALIVATILVIVFEFVGSTVVLRLSIIFYALCLAALVAFAIVRLYFSAKLEKSSNASQTEEGALASSEVEKEVKLEEPAAGVEEFAGKVEQSESESGENPLVLTHGQRVLTYVKLGVAAVALVFVLIICFMF